ncbi:MAG: type II toxin-antitoxin system RelE/ParE family toxin, partial [Xanthomonadales bacterium]|nr:type II toxin-antitoxin system RelE/ParE family toxin [Xanthomonadales bacterium]
ASHPEIGSRWVARSRRLPLRQFPYSVVYRIDPEFVLILAIAHHRRDPTDIEKGLPT